MGDSVEGLLKESNDDLAKRLLGCLVKTLWKSVGGRSTTEKHREQKGEKFATTELAPTDCLARFSVSSMVDTALRLLPAWLIAGVSP
jgi:hypothetical protein